MFHRLSYTTGTTSIRSTPKLSNRERKWSPSKQLKFPTKSGEMHMQRHKYLVNFLWAWLLSLEFQNVVSAQRSQKRCYIPETLQGEWYSREDGENTYTTIDSESINIRGRCLDILNTNNDNFTFVFQKESCYHCVRLYIRTLNVLEKIETGCVNLNTSQDTPDIKTVCRGLDNNNELITLFSQNPTPKNCRSSLEGVWKFAYQNRYKFTGECKHPEANITACQTPGTQFFILNQQFNLNYRKCDGMDATEDGEVQFKCLGDWYIGKNHFFAVVNARESRIDEKYRCFLGNRDDDFFLAVSITPECNTLKTPQEGPERLRLEPVKTDIVPPKCKLPANFTGQWVNTANFDAEVIINVTHIVEHWKPDQGREKQEVYVCQERRDSRFVLARMGINGCQKDYVCFEFVPRHQNIIRYRRGKAMITDEFSTVCNWAMFPGKTRWRYDMFIKKNPVAVKCPVAGKFKFEQKGDVLFETRIRGGVTDRPRPNVYCKENISDFSVCDKDQRIIYIDSDYCISVNYAGQPVDIYSEPDYKMQCIGFWKENLKSYLITYDEEDAYSKYRCWVYQRADLNRVLMSLSVGAFCFLEQDVISYESVDGAQVSLAMVEYERENDDCPMYFDDGSNPYRIIVEQALQLGDSATSIHINSLQLAIGFLIFFFY